MPRKPRLTQKKGRRATGQSAKISGTGSISSTQTSVVSSLAADSQVGDCLQKPSFGGTKRKSRTNISDMIRSQDNMVPSTSKVCNTHPGPSSKKMRIVHTDDNDSSSDSSSHSPVRLVVTAQIHVPPFKEGENKSDVGSRCYKPNSKRTVVDWDAIMPVPDPDLQVLPVPVSPIVMPELSPVRGSIQMVQNAIPGLSPVGNPLQLVRGDNILAPDNLPVQQENFPVLQEVPVENPQDDIPIDEIEALLLEAYLEEHRVGQNEAYMRAVQRRAEPSYLGPFNMVCSHCSALFFVGEKNTRGQYNGCCNRGKVSLPDLRPLPNILKQLFDGTHPQSRLFRLNIQQYNNAFQFASYEATLRNLPAGRAPPIYAIQGHVYHHISDVDINNPAQRYGPIYFLDPDEAVDRRVGVNNNLDRQLINRLEVVLREINPYARSYYHLRQRFDIELENIARLRQNAVDQNNLPPVDIPDVTLELLSVRGNQNRRYDLPANREVAVVYRTVGDEPATPNLRIYVRDRPTRFRTVKFDSEILDPLVFPLLFPQGDLGWHFDIPQTDGRRRVTLCDYYSYRLSYRDGEKRFFYGGKLNQLYMVSAYIKIEANRLNFIRLNQDKLRAEQYVGLADFLHRRMNDQEEGFNLGRMVILPSSFLNGPRSQMQRFQDAMSMVVEYGFPTLFITMTCNPKWREIIENIPHNHQVNDHSMLIARVFKQKLDTLINEIIEKRIFGVVQCLIYVIEFQKCGLPHSHILVTLQRNDRIVDPFLIDSFICAELPDQDLEPVLFEIVSKNMIHGPCGVHNPNCPCMIDGRCSKLFPKSFNNHTIINESGQVEYRRRNNGRTATIMIRGTEFHADNTWVVPYNPYLLLRYNCHINVENCATNVCIKYLYKYFFKGSDSALVRVNAEYVNYDEIESFINCRYMTPTESSWRINQFPLHYSTHTVYRLCIHLPYRQVVRFQPGFEHLALDRFEITQLTGWFNLNQVDPDANQYFYRQIPLHYVWNAAQLRWTRRQRDAHKIIVRISGVNVRNKELYYLRLLLLHVTGARSYEDVRTVNGVIFETFHQACQERNLLADDLEFQRALREASIRHMPNVLREMFCYMLLFCDINDKRALWEEFLDVFVEDFIRNGMPRDLAIQHGLIAIQRILLSNGTRLAQFGLPEPVIDVQIADEIINVQYERDEADNLRAQLNPEQLLIYQAIVDAYQTPDNNNRLFLLDAAAGCGKSFVFKTLISYFRGQDVPILTLAPTGVAASLLKGGRTLHSRFKLPFDINETTTLGAPPLSPEGRFINDSKVIFIYEISMVTRLMFNVIERGLRDICSDNRPFANKIVILGGDFRQTLPIIINGNRATIVDACVKNSRHWHLFRCFHLHENVRAPVREFSQWLLQVGDDTILAHRRSYYGKLIPLPTEIMVATKEELVEFCSYTVNDQVFDKVILTPLNETCHQINSIAIGNLIGETKTYYSVDSIDVTDDPAAEVANYSIEFLNSITPTGFPLHQLVLKEGALVYLMRNLNVRKGLCNGTRLIVKVLGDRYIDCEIIDMTGQPSGKRVFIPRIDLVSANVLPFKFKRRQFPLRLAYAMTINKSQGQTFNKVGVYLPNPVFAHGQLYVALSRATNIAGLRIHLEKTPLQEMTETVSFTRNVVYREIL